MDFDLFSDNPSPSNNTGEDASYPPVSFYFKLNFSGQNSKEDTSFQEASGLSVDTDLFEIKEGGENRYIHRLPGRKKYQNLVLKRGITAFSSPLTYWCKETLEGGYSEMIKTKTVKVTLLNPQEKPLMVWNIIDAFPVKWEVSNFNAQENQIAIETLELAFAYFTRAQ